MLSKESILNKLKHSKPRLSELGVRNIGLFGSYLRGEQTQNSDIDLLLDFEPHQETFDNFMAVCEFFEELFQNQKIEVVTRNGLSPYIGPKILTEVQYA